MPLKHKPNSLKPSAASYAQGLKGGVDNPPFMAAASVHGKMLKETIGGEFRVYRAAIRPLSGI